ncbi:response regulator (plasmid) [Paracoccus liaowanqingii]|uniref:Response regulator n=1 Tax=Paracoccus liaowanqingii TaxID=2560053 RepID=A0A4Y5STC0_9RHOB|nr:response regulator [Paracoccus liaowanqingii]
MLSPAGRVPHLVRRPGLSRPDRLRRHLVTARAPARRVLIVEDDWLIASLCAVELERAGLAVTGPFPAVAPALDAIDAGLVDVALLDVHLGPEDSFAVVDRLDALGIPLAFLTGYDASDLPQRYAARPLITKPVRMGHLLEIVRDLLDPGDNS